MVQVVIKSADSKRKLRTIDNQMELDGWSYPLPPIKVGGLWFHYYEKTVV